MPRTVIIDGNRFRRAHHRRRLIDPVAHGGYALSKLMIGRRKNFRHILVHGHGNLILQNKLLHLVNNDLRSYFQTVVRDKGGREGGIWDSYFEAGKYLK